MLHKTFRTTPPECAAVSIVYNNINKPTRNSTRKLARIYSAEAASDSDRRSAFTPGNTLPSNNAMLASPPLVTWVTCVMTNGNEPESESENSRHDDSCKHASKCSANHSRIVIVVYVRSALPQIVSRTIPASSHCRISDSCSGAHKAQPTNHTATVRRDDLNNRKTHRVLAANDRSASL